MTPDQIERLLHTMCDAAEAETLPRFRKKLAVTNKLASGFDPVTEADKAAERAIRHVISTNHSDHGILGEEEEAINSSADYRWIIDPIDGTRAFISGLPAWGTLIGLSYKGQPVAGVMHQPFTDEKFMATPDGAKSIRQGEVSELHTSKTTNLAEAAMMTTDPFLFSGSEAERFENLRSQVRLTRYGFDCYAYAMVAAGNIELVVESDLNPYDIAPLIPIVERAGGVVTTWNGGSAANGGQIIAAANRQIHAAALQILSAG